MNNRKIFKATELLQEATAQLAVAVAATLPEIEDIVRDPDPVRPGETCREGAALARLEWVSLALFRVRRSLMDLSGAIGSRR